ncbi:MAG: DUF3892 domain-containing protein [Flavobacterium sp.]
MSQFKISGVWKDSTGTITHYAFHTVTPSGATRAVKKSKVEAIKLLETTGNTAVTWIWNYSQATWVNGETVQVVNSPYGKYLRSNPDNKLRDNLENLINYDWIQP